MWADACALVEQAERMHRRFFELLSAPATEPVWEPPANVFTTGREILVAVALPGAGVDDVGVELAGHILEVRVRVPPPVLGPRAGIVRLEIPYGIMRRRIELPVGRYLLSERQYRNGCLYLRLTEATR
jgi:HSP20 family protein